MFLFEVMMNNIDFYLKKQKSVFMPF